MQQIVALLTREDIAALIVDESGTPLVPVATADAIGVALTEFGLAEQAFLNRLGPVLLATILYRSAELSVRGLARTVRCLMNLLTVRMP